MERMFREAFERYSAVTAGHLASVARTSHFSSDDEKRSALRLAGEAYFCVFDMSPRDAADAIPLLIEAGAEDALSRLGKVAFDRGNLRLMSLLLRDTDRLCVPYSETELAEWFRMHAVRWFDLFVDVEKKVAFMNSDDQEMIRRWVRRYFNPRTFWKKFFRGSDSDKKYPVLRRELLCALAAGENAIVDLPDTESDHSVDFSRYVQTNGLEIVRRIQKGGGGGRTTSDVYFVRDKDGITKVFKQMLDHNALPIRHNEPSEDEVFARIGGETGRLVCPTRVVTTEEGNRYAVFPVIYGRSYLAENGSGVLTIAGEMAETLSCLHRLGILYGDIRNENIVVDQDGSGYLIDLGSARFVSGKEGGEVPVLLEDRRFATPECIKRRRAGLASDIFQLGVVIAGGILGKHPFALSEDLNTGCDEGEVLRYTWPLCLEDPFVSDASSLPDYVRSMMTTNPQGRPSAKEVAELLRKQEILLPSGREAGCGSRRVVNSGRPVILFPARMGLPHKGHIEYIRRLVSLGFHVKISLQRSYTCTERDPIPKWFVMKMVARSLIRAGCDKDVFSFVFTPYFDTQQEMKMFFAFMPEYEFVQAVASGNPSVQELFSCLPCLDQKAVFGVEGEEYETRSWGEILRRAVREGDEKVFEEYAAEGVTDILALEDLRARYVEMNVPFVQGRVRLKVNGIPGTTGVEDVRLMSYVGPEQSIVDHLRRKGCVTELVDPYSRDSVVRIGGTEYRLVYSSSALVGNDFHCSFVLEPA